MARLLYVIASLLIVGGLVRFYEHFLHAFVPREAAIAGLAVVVGVLLLGLSVMRPRKRREPVHPAPWREGL